MQRLEKLATILFLSKLVQWEVAIDEGYCLGILKNSDATLEFKARMDSGGRL